VNAPARPKRTILLIEDDPDIRAVVAEVCRQDGYQVVEAASGRDGIQVAMSGRPDLVLLDWVLPDVSGVEVCRQLRRQGLDAPILMLTGRTSKVDMIVGLEVGADDYITKPFDSRELTARVGAHMRRMSRGSGGHREGLVRVGLIEIDTEGRRVRVDEREVRLTMTEFNLLALLASNAGRVLSRAQLLEKVWGYLAEVDNHSVDPHIQRLRKKLASGGSPGVELEAVPGLGYRLSSLEQ
jgi:two-component system alkaline phosphatase synthesis response regulator PhoP